jgi:hypothetical protein
MNTQTLSEYALNLLDRQSFVEDGMKEFSAILNKAESHPSGLTLDHAKTPEWREAKRQYAIYFAAYRRINKQLSQIRTLTGYQAIDGKRVAIYQYQ